MQTSRGLGGMLPQKILKLRGPEMLISAFVHEIFLQEFNLARRSVKWGVVFGNLQQFIVILSSRPYTTK